jgi:hypothetical protein
MYTVNSELQIVDLKQHPCSVFLNLGNQNIIYLRISNIFGKKISHDDNENEQTTSTEHLQGLWLSAT